MFKILLSNPWFHYQKDKYNNNVVGSEVIPLVSLKKRRQTLDLPFLFKCVNSKFMCHLCSLFPIKVPRPNLHNPGLFIVSNNRVNATRNGSVHRLTSLFYHPNQP